ncbi:MAG: FemAB family PEP-CTERM system-associated protein [Methylococcaceae bacterium]|nr:FemAB family PEP-CTERM system-associated protein [Methylococcaceae bacterium]MCI0667479.1 FemAB family PEP-CTERM system-associated protein [Methylococcaceae bacterium]MCI0733298.1 FemAB family PEP-CTERM system-associated protein [Methylococcaceae bacterium]
MYRIKSLGDDPFEKERWDAFVERCPEATFFHKAGWKDVIGQSFGHSTYYLYAEASGNIEAVLPLGHIKSRLFGNALISAPFCVYGGIAAASRPARDALDEAASKLARDVSVDYLEMRNRTECIPERPRKHLYVTFRRKLDRDHDVNFKAIPRKQRAVIRKGIDSGLYGVIDPDLDRFYRIYAESVRNLGTPVFSKSYFQALREIFGESCEILTIERKGIAVSSVMSFYFRDEVLPYYGGGTAGARELKSNDFMYWDLMNRAVSRGVKVFDYGRSKQGTGSYRFKTHWGFEPEPLHYEFDLVKSGQIPDINPLNPKYRIFIGLWRKLPLPVSMLLGPWISRNLG